MSNSFPEITKEESYKYGYIGKIPVRNLWLLMLYASELFKHQDQKSIKVEENLDQVPDLVAEVLVCLVELRIKRNLTYGYQHQEATLNRIRGRVDLLKTERYQLLRKGKIACKYDLLTVNTPRNRYVRAALTSISNLCQKKDLAHKCRTLATSLWNMGVVGEKPSHFSALTERFGRHDAQDRGMINAAQLAFELALPTEELGTRLLPNLDRSEQNIRKLFEKAVAGYYCLVLKENGWKVSSGKWLQWPIEKRTSRIDELFPAMQTDIILEHKEKSRRVVIDTKFANILTKGEYRKRSLKSGYIYQIYSYLRSQEGIDDLADNASGILLHPSVGEHVDETVRIQGHDIRFVTVDLAVPAKEVRNQLNKIVEAYQ